MKPQQGGLLALSGFGMELTWRYAWAAFIMGAVIHVPFPLPEAFFTLGLSAALTWLARGRGWRVIHILGLQALGFMIAALRTVYVFGDFSHAFLDRAWFLEFLHQPRDPTAWCVLVLVLFWVVFFWLGGVLMARRSTAYVSICNRFDLGVTALFLLLLLRLALLAKAGVEVGGFRAEFLLVPFFIFGLLAVGLARHRGDARRVYLAGYRKTGIILSFSVFVILFAGGLILLFFPHFITAAETGYGLLKMAARPLGPVLIAVLRFLFAPGRARQAGPTGSPGGGDAAMALTGEESAWVAWFEKMAGWGFLALIGLAALAGCALGIWFLVRWLFSKTPEQEREKPGWGVLRFWFLKLKAFLWRVRKGIRGGLTAPVGPVDLYACLLGWGRRSGLPRSRTETPAEYGFRLMRRFPARKGDIGAIIEAFNLQVYGGRMFTAENLAPLRTAWRRLRSPSYWPARLKTWFSQPPVS